MKLSKYIPQGGVEAFSHVAGVHHTTVRRIIRGGKPSMRIALKNVVVTNGKVTLVDLGFSKEEAKRIEEFHRATSEAAA